MEPTIEPLIKPFINAYYHAAKMLEGMMASLTVSLGKLSSENIYYVLSGNDFTLDVANPKSPKVLCLASNPQKANIYGAVMSLYLTAIKRMAIEQQQQPLSMVLEEFPSIYFSGIDRFLAICRSYLIAATMVVQDISQLRTYYGKDQADVIMNITGNIIAAQTTGDTADFLSRRFGKINQEKKVSQSTVGILLLANPDISTSQYRRQRLARYPQGNSAGSSRTIRMKESN